MQYKYKLDSWGNISDFVVHDSRLFQCFRTNNETFILYLSFSLVPCSANLFFLSSDDSMTTIRGGSGDTTNNNCEIRYPPKWLAYALMKILSKRQI